MVKKTGCLRYWLINIEDNLILYSVHKAKYLLQ
jgi:hypothetical protein